ncbi:MAG: MexH family multidrug efflux RND transporter periplasmic adaptor subunit [Lysobacteraceae bacterium]|nr:MAG: MexH family multidrug efflux RND transporter periplasmic adaptor subunit [Xanthomonadaceae bacterium]
MSTDGQEENDEENQEQAVPVETALVESGDVYASWDGSVTLESDREAVVVAKTNGILLELLAEEGDEVKAGQVLARLDKERQRLEVERALATLRRLENDFRRSTEMFSRNLTSSEEHERIRFETESQQAAVDLAKLQLEYTDIVAPINGVVSERMVKIGNLISEQTPMFRVTEFDPLQGIVHVPEHELSTLRKGQVVQLMADALPDRVFEGVVARISPVVDSSTGTFRVTTEFSDPGRDLKPGMFARLRIVHATRNDVVTVPRDAIVYEDGRSYAYLVEGASLEDAKAKRVELTTGFESEGRVEVSAGVSLGDIVVTAGKGSIGDGTRIEDLSGLLAGRIEMTEPVDTAVVAQADADEVTEPATAADDTEQE